MKKIFLIVFIALTTCSLWAQDKHFTQFYASPLTLNPALTGAFSGRYRVSGIYRDQWRGVLDNPYTTFGAAVDVRFALDRKTQYEDAVAIGLQFFTDKVGGLDFNTNQISLLAAFHKGLDQDKKQFLSAGIQASLAQRNINYEDITFHDQFNGIDGYVFPTGENLPENNFSFSDFSAGINYSYSPKRQTQFFAGLSLHHFLQPQLSFYQDEDANYIGDSKLFMKISGQLSASFPLNDNLSLLPRFLFATQGPHLQMNIGSNIRIPFGGYGGNALQIGTWARPVRNDDSQFYLDAVVALVGFEFSGVFFGLSYDINIPDLTTYKVGQNAFEFSITYLGNFEDDSIMCPSF